MGNSSRGRKPTLSLNIKLFNVFKKIDIKQMVLCDVIAMFTKCISNKLKLHARRNLETNAVEPSLSGLVETTQNSPDN